MNISSDIDILAHLSQTKPKYLVLCTYTLSLAFLENRLLRRFCSDYGTKIVIFTSLIGYTSSFDESNSISFAGIDYVVVPVNDYPYAFHPKLFLSIDEKGQPEIVCGGTNFTYRGLCLNWDTVDRILPDSLNSESRDSLLSFIAFLDSKTNNSFAGKVLKTITEILYKFPVVESDAYFLHNCKQNLGSQIIDLVPGPITKLEIVSPFWDSNLDALRQLMAETSCKECTIIINSNDKNVNVSMCPLNTNIYCAQISLRYVHSKCFFLYHGQSVSAFIGSANCTMSGFWKTAQTGNCEIGILRKNLPKEVINGIVSGLKPKLLIKSEYWDFEEPSRPEIPLRQMLFEAQLDFTTLTITAMSEANLGAVAEARYIKRDGAVLTDFIVNPKIEGNTLAFSTEHAIQLSEGSCRIILISKGMVLGQSWIMQNDILGRSKAARSILYKIEALRNNDENSLALVMEIISFFNENIRHLGVSPARQAIKLFEERSNTSPKGLQISGVSFASDKVNFIDYEPSSARQIYGIEPALLRLLSEGMQSHESDLDLSNEDYTNVPSHIRAEDEIMNRGGSEEEESEREKDKSTMLDAYNRLPSLGTLFSSSLVPTTKKIFQIECKTSFDDAYFSAITRLFMGMRIARFVGIHLYTKVHHKLPINLTSYFSSCGSLVYELIDLTNRIVSSGYCTWNTVESCLIKSPVLLEALQFIAEAWTYNYEYHLIWPLTLDVMYNFLSRFEPTSVDKYASDQSKQWADESFYLVSPQSIYSIIQEVNTYARNRESDEVTLKKHLKYRYWVEAARIYEMSCKIRSGDKDASGLVEDRRRLDIIMARLLILEQDEACIVCGVPAKALHNVGKRAGIDKVFKGNLEVFCPQCQQHIRQDRLRDLKQYKVIFCSGCGLLILPVRFEENVFERKNETVGEWKLSEQERKILQND